MTTRSGTNYNPSDNPNSGGNPTDTSPLEAMFREFTQDMHTRFDKMNNDIRDLRTETNRRLNHLEHPEPPPIRERRPPPEDRDFQDYRGQYQPRPPHREFGRQREFDQDERILKSVKIEAPSSMDNLTQLDFLIGSRTWTIILNGMT